MHDDLKPRRPRWEEVAEIRDHIASSTFQDPPLYELIEKRKEDEEAALVRRERDEMPWERAESELILQAEAEIRADIPIRRRRELGRTPTPPHQAAAASF
jgi:hypothetical protein